MKQKQVKNQQKDNFPTDKTKEALRQWVELCLAQIEENSTHKQPKRQDSDE